MTTLEQFGAYVAQGARPGLTPAVRERLRLHVADTVGAWAAGRRTPEGRAVAAFQAALASRDSALDQVLQRCAVTRLSEIDDIHLSSNVTPGAVIVPAALTLAQAHGASRATLAEAILVGYEAIVRLGLALDGPAILYRGIWPTYFTAPFGVAAVAARILGLDATRAAHALALALSVASPGVGHQGGPAISRWIALGQAARNGGFAAQAAQAGFTADLGLLDGSFFTSVYAIEPQLERLTQGLGATSVLGETSLKPWCAARQTIAASYGLKRIVADGVAPADISAVAVFVPPPYFRMVNHGINAGERTSYLTSVPYQVAAGALSPEEQYRLDPSDAEPSREVLALLGKVSVQTDEALLRHFPKAWPARIVVKTAAGEREKLVLEVPGDPGMPLEEADVARKFSRVASPVLGEANARTLSQAALRVLDEDGAASAALKLLEQD